MKIFAFIFLIISASFSIPCQDYKCDSLAVRAILDSNGLGSVSVDSVTGTDTSGRVDMLDLSNKQLTILPPEIGQLANLAHLRLNGNRLTALPPEIGQLKNLATMYLPHNQLTALPPEIGNLTELYQLILSFNELTTLPPEFGQLTNLTLLHLGINKLTALPAEIVKLTNLNEMTFRNNNLTTLPPEIGQWTNLTSLNLNDNQLITLPPEIGQMINLFSLKLNNNKLATLPPEIGQLTNLTTLRLDSNALCSLPDSISDWVNQYVENPSGPLFIILDGKVILDSTPTWKETQNCKTTIEMGSQSPLNILALSITPNPFNPSTKISWTGLKGAATSIEIYNSQGKRVKIFNDPRSGAVVWNASAFPSGIYFAKIRAGKSTLTKTLALLK